VPAEIAVPRLVGALERVEQHVGTEQVVAHRRQRERAAAGHGPGGAGLFHESADALAFVRFHDAELVTLANRHGQGGHAHLGVVGDVEIDHLTDVHAVDVIRPEDRHDVGLEAFDQVDVLVNRIGRALEPLGPVAHLRRDHGDEMLRDEPRHRPRLPDVLDERL
jgi:hypothetical protein